MTLLEAEGNATLASDDGAVPAADPRLGLVAVLLWVVCQPSQPLPARLPGVLAVCARPEGHPVVEVATGEALDARARSLAEGRCVAGACRQRTADRASVAPPGRVRGEPGGRSDPVTGHLAARSRAATASEQGPLFWLVSRIGRLGRTLVTEAELVAHQLPGRIPRERATPRPRRGSRTRAIVTLAEPSQLSAGQGVPAAGHDERTWHFGRDSCGMPAA